MFQRQDNHESGRLASLIDHSLSAPFVPPNVFTGIQGTDFTGYWSATTVAENAGRVWTVIFGSGIVASSVHKFGDNHFRGVFFSHAPVCPRWHEC